MLEVSKLSCTRGDRTLFRDLSFKVESRALVHVAGANGSGKTSLLRMLCGLGAIDEGNIHWRGETVRSLGETYSRELVYIGHLNALKDDLSAVENLSTTCALAGHTVVTDEIRSALTQFGLDRTADLPVRALSQGQKRRSALARLALSASTPLWILDEPFSALDAHSVTQLEQLIVQFVDAGGAVIFTTHQDGTISTRVSQRVDLDDFTAAA
jgi:heme exporter protein A